MINSDDEATLTRCLCITYTQKAVMNTACVLTAAEKRAISLQRWSFHPIMNASTICRSTRQPCARANQPYSITQQNNTQEKAPVDGGAHLLEGEEIEEDDAEELQPDRDACEEHIGRDGMLKCERERPRRPLWALSDSPNFDSDPVHGHDCHLSYSHCSVVPTYFP